MTVLNQCSVLWLSRRSLPALQPDEAELSLGMADRVWEAALTTNQGAAMSIRINHLEIPDAVRAGNEAILTCDYDLEGQTLQTMKWYKGTHEFYRYQPRNYPEQKQFFVLPQLFLDEYRCDSRSVVLTDVHADMSGYYTCEVTAQTTFETVEAKQYLLVVQPPSVGPEISGVPMEVSSGEWLKVQCHLPWMNVKPSLEFFVNGKGVKHMVRKILKENVKGRKRLKPFEYSLVREEEEEPEPEFEAGGTTTVLEFPVKNHHVRQGKVEVKCKASASKGLYESETVVQVPVVRSFSFFERSSSVATCISPEISVIINVCISIIVRFL